MQAQKAKSAKRIISDFRLAAASVILGNDTHTACISSDMRNTDHIAELCEQYSLFIALHSLGTRYGLSVCRESIYSYSANDTRATLISASLADRYPFQISDMVPIVGKDFENLQSLSQQLIEESLETIGDIYQQTLSAPLAINDLNKPYIDLKSNQRVSGEFYTPSWVADRSFALWLNSDSANKLKLLKQDLRIIDPSCGTGNFLLAAMRMADSQLSESAQILRFAKECLFGRDIDGKAIEIAKVLVVFMVARSFLKRDQILSIKEVDGLLAALDEHFQVRDGLLNSIALGLDMRGGTAIETVIGTAIETAVSLAHACVAEPKFDLVITNPPYISFGSRDQQTLSKEWQLFLKKRFPASSEYKVRLTSMFQEIGIQMIKPGGQCIFLVPDAFLTGSYYQKIREHILNNVEIVQLTELPESTIGDATVGRWCLAQYAKFASSSSSKELLSASSVNLQSLYFDKEKVLQELNFRVPLESLVSTDKKRFQLLFSDEDLQLVELCKDFDFLKEELRGHTGIRARNGQASIVARRKLNKYFHRGITSGAEVTAYKIDWNENWIEIIAEKLFAGGFDPNIIEREKVLVRQTGDRLVAAADKGGFYHLNNVHSFVPQKTIASRSVDFYTSLLNSSFFLYYYRLKTREHKRALAQIDIETVEHMPLPPVNLKLDKDIEKLGVLLGGPDPECKQGRKRTSALAEIDELVFDLFGINRRLREHILAGIQV